jgi:membrane protein
MVACELVPSELHCRSGESSAAAGPDGTVKSVLRKHTAANIDSRWINRGSATEARNDNYIAHFWRHMNHHAQIILEPNGTEVATAAGGARRYRKPLRSIRWRDIQSILGESFEGWTKHNAPRLGAALSFYTLLSIAPLLLVLVAVVGLTLGRQSAEAHVIQQVQALMGVEGATIAQSLLEGSRNTAHGIMATVFGVLILLFGASGVMIELRDALNTIWEVPYPQISGLKLISSFVKERLFSFALVLAVGFLLVVSLAISAWIAALGAFTASILPAYEVIMRVVNSWRHFA